MDHPASAHTTYMHGAPMDSHASVHQLPHGAEHAYASNGQHPAYGYSLPPGYGYAYTPSVYGFQPSMVNPAVVAGDAGSAGQADPASNLPATGPNASDPAQAQAQAQALNMQQYMPYQSHYFANSMPGNMQSTAYADMVAAATGATAPKPPKPSKEKTQEVPKKLLRARLKQPKQAPSAWQIFFNEELARLRQLNPGDRLNVAHVSKGAGEKYNSLPAYEKARFQEESLRLKAQWEQDMRAWKQSLSPEDIKLENAYRTQQRKAGKSRKSNLKDPHAPKKPMSAYFLFLRAIRASPEMKEKVFGQAEEMTKQSVLAALKWRELPDEEKQPFVMKAEQDKVRYDEARNTYNRAMASGLDPVEAATRAYDAGITVAAELAATNPIIQKLQATSLPPSISFDVNSDDFENHSDIGMRKSKKKKTAAVIQSPGSLIEAQ